MALITSQLRPKWHFEFSGEYLDFDCLSASYIKVPITTKNVFHLVQSLYGTRENAAKIFALSWKQFFTKFLKIKNSEQQNHLKKSGYSAVCDVIPGH